MADQWHYQMLGEEFGPVSEAALRSLIGDGTIGPGDEVRRVGSDAWQRADSLPTATDAQAVTDGSEAEALDLDAMLATPASAPATSKSPQSESDPAAIDLDAMLAPSEPVSRRKAEGSEWYYRSGGQKHGPLDFDTLFEHIAEGKLSRYDEILSPGERDWAEAQTIVGLFTDEEPDLDAMLADTAGHSAQPDAPPQKAEPKKAELLWHYRVLNQELGPIDFQSLYDLVVEGNLRPDDEIRGEGETDWKRADTMVGLFPDDVSESSAADSETATASDEGPADDDGEEAEWYISIDGQESGPVTFGRLMQMAADDKLSRTDQIRLTKLGNWMEADSMVGLFPEQTPEEPPAQAAAQPPPSTVSEKPSGDADDWAAAVLSEPAPEPASPEPAAPPPEPSRPTVPPSPSPTPAKRPAFTPPPKMKSKKSGSSFSLPSGLMDSLTDPKVLGAGGIVLLAAALFFVPWGSMFSAGHSDLIQQLDEIWPQVKALYEKEAPESEWAALATKVGPKLKEIAKTAKDRGAGPAAPGLHIAHMLSNDQIPKVLESKQETKAVRIKTIDNFLARGKSL